MVEGVRVLIRGGLLYIVVVCRVSPETNVRVHLAAPHLVCLQLVVVGTAQNEENAMVTLVIIGVHYRMCVQAVTQNLKESRNQSSDKMGHLQSILNM